MFSSHQSIFNLKLIGEQAAPAWKVISFQAQHDFNGHPEVGEIEISLDKSIVLPDLVQRKICLEVQAHTVIFGVVERVAYERYDDSGHYLQLSIVSTLYDYLRHSHRRIFVHKTIREIVTDVLKASGWPMDQISFSLSESASFRYSSVRQREETDWSFFHRLLHQAGWFYQTQVLGTTIHLVISDQLNSFSVKQINLSGDQIHFLRQVSQLKPSSVHIEGFCECAPSAVLTARISSENKVAGFGEEFHHVLDGLWMEDQVKHYTQQSCARLDHERNSLWLQTEELGLDLWDEVQLSQDEHTKNYRVITMRHRGEELHGQKCRYCAEVELIPLSNDEDMFQLESKDYDMGLRLAEMMSSSEEVADMDEVGYYRVKYLAEEPQYSKTARVPKSLELVHDKSGCHFPLRSGHSVIMIHREEDGNRPVILSVMPDENHRDSVTQTNPHHHLMRMENGHELLLDDQVHSSQLSLQTFDQSERLLLSQKSKKGCSLLELCNRKGSTQVEVANDSQFVVDGHMVFEVKHKNDAIVHQNVLWESTSSQICIESQGDYVWKVKGLQTLFSGHGIQLMSGDYQRWWSIYEVKISARSLGIEADGSLELFAGQILSIQGNMTFIAGGSCLSVSGGQATISANHITVIGT